MSNSLYVAWRGADPREGWGPVGQLSHENGAYRFWYTKGARQHRNFRPFPNMDRLDEVYESQDLFPLFANRLLSRSRKNYEDYLRWSGFENSAAPDPIAILGVTEGLRETDRVEVFPYPRKDADGNYRNRFFVHGLRWQPPEAIERLEKLTPGIALHLAPQPENAFDPHAVALCHGGYPVGYVPRYLARDVNTLFWTSREGVEVNVVRLNPDAPLQQRILCEMVAQWPEGFRPCQDEAFEPIPKFAVASTISN